MAGKELTFGQSAALSAGQGVLNFGLGLAANAIQNRQQRKLMALQQKYQKDMFDYTFDKQNQYNLPSEQIARMKQAGLNPNLAYGQVQNATMSGSTGSMPNAQSSPLHSGQIDFALGSQINQAKASANLDDTQAEYAKSMKRNQDIKNIFDAKRYLGDTADKFIEAELRNLNTQADYNEKRINEIDQNIAESRQRVAESIAQVGYINQNTANKVVEMILTGKKVEEIDQAIKESNSRISVNQRNCLVLQAQAKLFNLQYDFEYSAKDDKLKVLKANGDFAYELNSKQVRLLDEKIQKTINEGKSAYNQLGIGNYTYFVNKIEDLFEDIRNIK